MVGLRDSKEMPELFCHITLHASNAPLISLLHRFTDNNNVGILLISILDLKINYPLCTIAHTPRLPEHCVEYVKVILWEKEKPFGEGNLTFSIIQSK
jgi:hypothetical protein